MANDIKINLLPWREELREEKKKEFLNITVAIIVLAGAMVFGVDRYYNRAIDLQTSRNQFLEQEITILEGRIEEINLLQQKRNELLSRMKVIQELQGNRPIIVRVFDELARQLAPRVFFTSVNMQAQNLAIAGVAESNNRISNQLRNFTESEWFDKPNVTAIKAESKFGPQASQFSLTVAQTTPKKEEGIAMAAIEDLLESLQSFDLDQLNDINNIGSWPLAIKVIIWVLCFTGALALGYFLHVTNLQQELAGVTASESALKADYESKFFEAAHLESYRLQQKEMEDSFQAILRQLPSDTEIPGSIEDITLVGLKNGLTFTSIDLQPESRHEFYIEKPIAIIVSGSYHGIGSFVSDVADLSRIVTLHDFTIRPAARQAGSDTPGSHLTMQILARTYRYNDERG